MRVVFMEFIHHRFELLERFQLEDISNTGFLLHLKEAQVMKLLTLTGLVSILLSTTLSFAAEHRVVRQVEGTVFVDCGRGDGVKVGDTLWVFRRMAFPRPELGDTLWDEVPVAKLRVWFAGDRVSAASVEEKPLGDISLGDIARLPGRPSPSPRPRKPRTFQKTSSLRFSWAYVGYGSEGGIPDYYYKTEAGYRHFFFRGVGIRMGLGGVWGKSPKSERVFMPATGTYKDTTWQEGPMFYYGYGEVSRVGGTAVVAAITAGAMLGLHRDGVGGGFYGRVRIGEERDTHLEVGGSLAFPVGAQWSISLWVRTFRQWFIFSDIVAENLPSGEKWGVRTILGAAYMPVGGWGGYLQFGYEGRTARRLGPSVGIGILRGFTS